MNKTTTLWLLASICFTLPFLHPFATPCIFPAFVLLLFALAKTKTQKQVFRYSLLLGFIKALGVLSWVWYIYPLEWLTADQTLLQITLIGLYWITAALTLALGTSFAVVSTWHLWQQHRRGIYYLPVLWVLGEMLGAFLFSILTLGPGSTLQTHFSYGFVGYAVAQIPILRSAAYFGGVYTLSLLVIAISLLLYAWTIWFTTHKTQKHLLIRSVAFLSLIASMYGYHITHLPPKRDYTVLTTETTIDKKIMESADGYTKKRLVAQEALFYALPLKPDAVVLPEDMRFVQLFTEPRDVFPLLGDTLLIDSARTTTAQNNTVSRAYLIDGSTQEVYGLDKNFLTPHGEYMPYVHNFLLHFFLDTFTAQKLAEDLSYTTGLPNDYRRLPTQLPALLSCMESAWPNAAHTRTRGANRPFIAHTISHGWFSRTPYILWHQQDQMLRTQAIWSNTAIISAANMAPHAVYFPSGNKAQGRSVITGTNWSLYQIDL